MATMRIISNYHWNNLLYGYELTENERAEFDYIPADEIDSHDFIRYRGVLYDPAEFMRTPCDEPERQELNALCAWDGYQSDSYFSGVVIRYDDAFERYQIGTYIY
jgi:hypothetical protein